MSVFHPFARSMALGHVHYKMDNLFEIGIKSYILAETVMSTNFKGFYLSSKLFLVIFTKFNCQCYSLV